MAGGATRVLERLLARRVLRRWAAAARRADRVDLPTLRRQRRAARALRPILDALLTVADTRLLPDADPTPPAGADWALRPQPWRGPLPQPGLVSPRSGARLGDTLALFHDCDRAEMALRQLRCGGAAPFALQLEVFGFSGSFIGLAIDLPKAACDGLGTRHLLRLDTVIETEAPLGISARLNLRHGPNVERLASRPAPRAGAGFVEFDLAETALAGRRVEAAWIDLMLTDPAMNRVLLRDLVLSRQPRAAL